MNKTPVICFFTLSSGDWGGASRVLFTNLRLINRDEMTPLLLLPRSGPIENELRHQNLRYVIWGPMTEPGNWLSYFRRLIKALRFFRQKRVDVIHVNGSNFWRPAELLAARMLRIPIVAHYHVINSEPSPFMKLCSAAICVSRYTAEQSLPNSLPKPVIYNAINLSRFDSGHSLREELGISQTMVVVAFLGQIRDIKGVQDFISMARQITEQNACFLIAGECRDPKKFSGSYTEDDLKEMIGGDKRIRYIGYIGEVENVYHTSDIVVVPSRWHEPLGLINLEANACGKPVVATRVGGIPEVVEGSVNGYLVEAGDVSALVERVSLLIVNPGLRQQLGRNGRRLVENNYTTQPAQKFASLLLSHVR